MSVPPICRRCLNQVFTSRSRLCSSVTGPFDEKTPESDNRLSRPSSVRPSIMACDTTSPAASRQKQWSSNDHAYSPHSSPKLGSPSTDGHTLVNEHLSSVYQTVSRATIVGRTGAEAQIQTYDSGSRSATLSVATKYVSNRDGFPTVATQWHSVRVYDSASVYPLITTLPTGSQVYVEGDLRLSTVSRSSDVTKQFSSIIVSKNQGTIRVLHRPSSHSSSDGHSQQ